MIVTIARRVMGYALSESFFHASPSPESCAGCHVNGLATIRPIEWMHDEAENYVFSAPPLCRSCSMRLGYLSGSVQALWPGLTVAQVADIWTLVRAEEIHEMARQAARESARRTTLEEVEAALRAAQLAARHQGADDIREVA